MLITHEFHSCKLTFWLKFVCNPTSTLMWLSQSFPDTCRVVKNLSHPHMYPAGVKPGDALCLFASALILYASFSWSSKCHFFYMSVLCW